MVYNVELLRQKAAEAELRLAKKRMTARHKMNRMALDRKVVEIEKAISAKQNLELLTEFLKGQIEVMRHLGDTDAVQSHIEDMTVELETMTAELQTKTADLEARMGELNSLMELLMRS